MIGAGRPTTTTAKAPPPTMLLPSPLRRPRTWGLLAALLAAYAVAGFLAVPRLVAGAVRETVAADYGREARVGPVAFNPFTLALEVRDVALPDADGGPLLAFDRLFLDLEAASLWRRAWSFRAIAIDGLQVDAVLRPGGALNLADLASPRVAPGAPEPPEEPLPRVFIGELRVADGRIRFTDRDRAEPFTAELAPLAFALSDFSTYVDAGDRYRLDATVFGGSAVHWEGSLRAAPLASTGEFSIAAVPLPELGRYLGAALPVDLAAGELTVKGRYEFAVTDGAPRFRLVGGGFAIGGLAVRARGDSPDLVTVPTLTVTGVTADTATRTVAIQEIAATDGTVTVVRAPDGSVNLAALAGDPAAGGAGPASAGAAATEIPGPPTTAEAAWTVDAPRIVLGGFRVTITDEAVTPAAVLALAPLSLEVSGYSTAPGTTVRSRLDARVNDAGELRVEAGTQLDSLATTADVALAGIALAGFQPYVDRVASIAIRRGTLGLEGRIVTTPADDPVRLEFAGDAVVDDFRAVDQVLQEDFLRWRSLRLAGITYRSAPASARVREVVASGPYARVVIGPDGVTNLDTVFATPGGPSPAGGAAAAPRPGPARAPAASADPLPIRIDLVRVADGSMNFADLSINPRFATGIDALNGTVSGLASDPAARARVSLDGQVDRFSPVTIRGEVNPLAAETYLDLAMGFRNLELASFTPYSGRFAGYKIRQGKLSVDLKYVVADRRLAADHKFVINRLELGEKVESPDAIGLPLKLAIALLKDRNGVIDLDLPVEGSLDDPQFRIGPIVWRAFVNLLGKAVTAPFALLGSLFGGGEEINRIAFGPGAALATGDPWAPLVAALTDRPGLELDVPAVYSPEADGPALAEEAFRRRVLAAKRSEPAGRKGDPELATWDALVADRGDYERQLRAAWRREAGADAPLPAPSATDAAGAPVDTGGPEARIAALESALRARIVVTDVEFFELAKARANAVQARLLDGTGIAPERVFLVSPAAVEPRDGQVVMELALH